MKRQLLFISMLFMSTLYGAQTKLVDVSKLDSSIMIQMKYFTKDNFVGSVIDGYKANKCLMTQPAAKALVKAQKLAKAKNLSLLVHDCYRPQRAVNHFIRWSKDKKDLTTKFNYYPHLPKAKLFNLGYIAEKSGHSRGSTIDLTLYNLKKKRPLDMGTIYDFLDPLSNTDNPTIGKKSKWNRLVLVKIMKKAGFKNYDKEWWHYTLINEPNKDIYLDVPVE